MKIDITKTIEVPDIEDCSGGKNGTPCEYLYQGPFTNQCRKFRATLKDWFIESELSIKPCPICMEARKIANEKG